MAKSKSLPSTVVEVIRMLPPGYNISRIPKPVVDSLFRGEVPDFSLLPEELQQYLLEDGHRFIAALSKDVSDNFLVTSTKKNQWFGVTERNLV